MVSGIGNDTVIYLPGVTDAALNQVYVQVMRVFVFFCCEK